MNLIYFGKCKKSDRAGSTHPTVKNIEMLRHLIRLVVTESNGKIIDPFAGSGTLGEAAVVERKSVVMCEKENEYVGDILLRMSALEAR